MSEYLQALRTAPGRGPAHNWMLAATPLTGQTNIYGAPRHGGPVLGAGSSHENRHSLRVWPTHRRTHTGITVQYSPDGDGDGDRRGDG